MPLLPSSDHALLVRTDFSDDQAWDAICVESSALNEDGFQADVQPVSDHSFDTISWEAVKAAVPPSRTGSRLVLIADAVTFASTHHPVLVVDLLDPQGRRLSPFRCVTSSLWDVENNLNEGNVDWDSYADSCDESGVYRGP
jgi:hypothetical protein